MRALITGGGGFLGSHIAGLLHARNDEVVVLGRNRYPHLESNGTRTIQADLRDAQAVARACEGMDCVFHVGALVGIWGKRRDYWSINVDGTRNVIEGCRKHGVPKLVYTSSPSVVFDEGEMCGVDESQPYPPNHLAAYPETKAAAERLVLAANGSGLATIALRPHLIWGPGDSHLIPQVIAQAREGRLVQVGDGTSRVDVTYIDNAADAHLLAADALDPSAACAGKAYFLSQGEPVQLWPWLAEILDAVGAPAVRRSISFRTAYWLGAALELFHRAVGSKRQPWMTRFLATQLSKSHYFDITAARRDLGYRPRVATSEGIRRLIASLTSGPQAT